MALITTTTLSFKPPFPKISTIRSSPITTPTINPNFKHWNPMNIPHNKATIINKRPNLHFKVHNTLQIERPTTESQSDSPLNIECQPNSLNNYIEIKPNSNNKIWWSDIEVKNPQNVFLEGKWDSLHVKNLSVVGVLHALAICGAFNFTWDAFWVAVGLFFVTGWFGISLTYHRYLSHKSFKMPKWLEYPLAYLGVLGLQGDPIDWASNHRYHHQHCDSENDPHTPTKGFWFSYMNWAFDTRVCGADEQNNVRDLESQPFYRFMKNTYVWHQLALAGLLYAIGGFPYVAWGMGVRTILQYHITWMFNAACHVWGTRAWNTPDLSTNVWWMALPAFGEGWHNNHHAFGYSARHGLEWWQIDLTWYVIKSLEFLGLVTDVRLPTEADKKRLALTSKE